MTHIIGWIGMACMILGYFLVSWKVLKGDGGIYQALNIVGAAGLGINAYATNDFPIVVTEIIWIGIGISAVLHKRKADTEQ